MVDSTQDADQDGRTTPPNRRPQWVPGAVFGLGVASIAMLVGTNWLRQQILDQDIALVHAVGEIQTREATSHLWLEEYVGGDPIHVADVWENQDRSAYLIHAMLEGGEVRDRYVLDPLVDPALRRQALLIAEQIENFRGIARRRHQGYESGEPVGIGSAIDEEYDRVFEGMLADLRRLETDVYDHLEGADTRSRLWFRSILAIWIGIVTLAVWGLWTRERRRLLAEAALRESEAQLFQSQKMEAVGRLAGGLAHDINNYLAAISTQCELAKMKPGDPSKLAHRMDAVLDTASKASVLIRRLLAFGRRAPVQPRVININRIVQGLEKMLSRLIGEDVDLQVDLADDLWSVKLDPSQLEQAIVNLGVNARDAMPTGGDLKIETANCRVDDPQGRPYLAGRAGAGMEAGDYVVLTVSDTGIGIAPEIQDEIFEPFFTTKDPATSSGLGLATVYAIASQSGGGVRLYSEPEKGASFKIYLPRSQETESEAAIQEVGPQVGGSQRILLVEDNEELRRSTAEALEMMGYSIVSARDGEEALRAFDGSAERIDLLVTDVVMPGMSGREVAEQLRQKAPDLPTIFVSGYTDDVILRHGIRENEVHFLPKPFSIVVLAQKIQQVLEAENGAA